MFLAIPTEAFSTCSIQCDRFTSSVDMPPPCAPGSFACHACAHYHYHQHIIMSITTSTITISIYFEAQFGRFPAAKHQKMKAGGYTQTRLHEDLLNQHLRLRWQWFQKVLRYKTLWKQTSRLVVFDEQRDYIQKQLKWCRDLPLKSARKSRNRCIEPLAVSICGWSMTGWWDMIILASTIKNMLLSGLPLQQGVWHRVAQLYELERSAVLGVYC